MTNKEEYLHQLQFKIDMYEDKLMAEINGIKQLITPKSIYFNSVVIENIKVYERLVEELKRQKETFEAIFNDIE